MNTCRDIDEGKAKPSVWPGLWLDTEEKRQGECDRQTANESTGASNIFSVAKGLTYARLVLLPFVIVCQFSQWAHTD